MRCWVPALLLGVSILLAFLVVGPSDQVVTRPTVELAQLRADGARLYREGILPSGAPVAATVGGGYALTGEMVSCALCHGRSGLGVEADRKRSAPVTPGFLDAPRRGHRPRPAYTPATLATAIREGVDSGGNVLDPTMPRFHLDEGSMTALRAYLETLSTEFSPGASLEQLHIATVVTPDAAAEDRRVMLEVLTEFLRRKNAGLDDRRARRRSTGREYRGAWVAHVWELSGPPETWRDQLEARYAAQPVFMLVSGVGVDWKPVQDFCEARAIPSLLPNVDTPPDAPGYYTRYFSGGTRIEAQIVAVHLGRQPTPQRVLQVFRGDGPGAAAALSLRAALTTAGRDSAVDWALTESEPLTAALLRRRAQTEGATAFALWLSGRDLAALVSSAEALDRPIYTSSTLSGGLDAAKGLSSPAVFVAHPTALPGEGTWALERALAWYARVGLTLASPRARQIGDQTLYALMVAGDGVMDLDKLLYRDYLLENLDHMSRLNAFSAYFPRLSFGPGQHILSKGCSLVTLAGDGATPEWIVP